MVKKVVLNGQSQENVGAAGDQKDVVRLQHPADVSRKRTACSRGWVEGEEGGGSEGVPLLILSSFSTRCARLDVKHAPESTGNSVASVQQRNLLYP